MTPTEIDQLILAWQGYLKNVDWQTLTQGMTPRESGCGLLYELHDGLDRPEEELAIADMRYLQVSEPHYHPDGVLEVYFVLQGTALVVVGGKERQVGPGDTIVMGPGQTHYAIPDEDFVVAVVNTPPFQTEQYIFVSDDDPEHGFNKQQFDKLTATVE
ncbi:MAG TPA: cupin domain-containing protein [Patescibacteria group bacterium]|nr:cupin domain-containing protein [Patescibacteria group bacterium]